MNHVHSCGVLTAASCGSTVSAAAKMYYSGPGGSVRLLSSESVKVAGQDMIRRVYCLESDPSQRFMRLRDVAKVALVAESAPLTRLGTQTRAQSHALLKYYSQSPQILVGGPLSHLF